jgi:predicted nucleotidyltransferase
MTVWYSITSWPGDFANSDLKAYTPPKTSDDGSHRDERGDTTAHQLALSLAYVGYIHIVICVSLRRVPVFPLPRSDTVDMTLDEVLARLSRNPAVDGLVTVGSTGRDSLTPISDYDVLVVLAEMPVPLHVGITYIDHRLTDLLFATTTHVKQILAAQVAIDGDAWEGRIARWLMTGQVVFDRHGSLRQARAKLCSGDWIRSLEDIDAYGAWIGVNYNLLHTRRLIRSDDPVYLHAAELRMSMYGVVSVLLSYFRIHKLLWEGDKAAIRYLVAHDPPYFDLLQQFLRASDPYRKFAIYERIAAATLAPISTLWDGEPTVLWNDMLPASWETVEQSLAFWGALLRSDFPSAAPNT